MKITADEFNEKYPVGTPVTYYPVLPERPEIPPEKTRTRTPAWTLCGGRPLVSVDGRAGGVAISHVELREEDDRPSMQPADVDGMLDRITAAREEASSIRCPHCGRVQQWTGCDLADLDLVTYHGDDGPVDVECDHCEASFVVREDVERTYEVAKTTGELE